MIFMVEDVIQQAIEEQLKVLKGNVDIVDKIFAQATVTLRSQLKQYITKNAIKVVRGFPMDKAALPAYCILLGAEQEQVAGLGNYLGDGGFEESELTSESHEITISKSSNTITILNKPLYAINSITYNGETYSDLGLDYDIIDENRGIVELHFDIDPAVSTATIDYYYKAQGFQSFGTMFHAQYRVETWTSNGDLTVILYHLLKWIFLSRRNEFAEKGLVVQGLGGADFEPAPEYFPEFVFRRALTFECITDSSVETAYPYIQEIKSEGGLG